MAMRTSRSAVTGPSAGASAWMKSSGDCADRPQRTGLRRLSTEQACAETYAALVAQTSGRQRRWGATALTETAVLQLRLGGRPEDFPGAPELG